MQNTPTTPKPKRASDSIDRAYRIVSVFMDAERRQRQEQFMRDFIAKRNAENWA